MKRRNLDTGKPPRRPIKRSNKFSESVYGSSFVYLKFIVVWLFILLADFILEFRFEYIWPFWLLIQSVYETFKYQGLVYSVFFVCIAITSDTICLLFIPIQWLFFMASTYVWIHYVWHTDRGICLPTVTLWLFIMYIEATIRLRDIKNSQLHIDLCQPFAAHCIGHPVVTLGIGFKSYVLYHLKLRTQRQVQKENNFCCELLKYALPREQHRNHALAVTEKERLTTNCGCFWSVVIAMWRRCKEDASSLSNGILPNHHNTKKIQKSVSSVQDHSLQIVEVSTANTLTKCSLSNSTSSGTIVSSITSRKQSTQCNSFQTPSKNNSDNFHGISHSKDSCSPEAESKRRSSSSNHSKKVNSNSSDTTLSSSGQLNKGIKINNGNNSPKSGRQNASSRTSSISAVESEKQKTVSTFNNYTSTTTSLTNILTNGHVVSDRVGDSKVELISTPSVIEKLEACISKLKVELNNARKNEIELKNKIEHWTNLEHAANNELLQLKRENESLQTKLNSLVSCKQKDKQNMQTMEKRLKSEVDNRESAEKLLFEEKRRRKEEEENANRAAAAVAQSNVDKEAADFLRRAKKDLEIEIQKLHNELKQKEEECKNLKKEVQELQVHEKSIKESETLMSALEAMQEKNSLLEKSLSAETRLKLDLFSALGDVKRQLAIAHDGIYKREATISDLKGHMSDFLSILPEPRLRSPTPHYSTSFLEKPPVVPISPSQEYPNVFCTVPRTPGTVIQGPLNMEPNMLNHMQAVHLDPNAAMYTPNTSGV